MNKDVIKTGSDFEVVKPKKDTTNYLAGIESIKFYPTRLVDYDGKDNNQLLGL